jgi:hypothetical protein
VEDLDFERREVVLQHKGEELTFGLAELELGHGNSSLRPVLRFSTRGSRSTIEPGIVGGMKQRLSGFGWLQLLALLTSGCAHWAGNRDAPEGRVASAGLVSAEFIFEEAPTPECHASTVVETASSRGRVVCGSAGECG